MNRPESLRWRKSPKSASRCGSRPGACPKCPFQQRDYVYCSAAVQAAGFSLADLRRWGGKFHFAPRPSDPGRRAAIQNGTVNAIFDEGIKSWGQTALENGFRYLPIDGKVLREMKALGYRAALLSKSRFTGLTENIPTLDFSGWPMIVRADMPNDVAYALCEAIEMRRQTYSDRQL